MQFCQPILLSMCAGNNIIFDQFFIEYINDPNHENYYVKNGLFNDDIKDDELYNRPTRSTGSTNNRSTRSTRSTKYYCFLFCYSSDHMFFGSM